jgi:hypothetical protein
MLCPKCHNNSIPFLKTWARSGFGKYRCFTCGADSRVRKSVPLMIGSTCLGLLAGGLAIYYQSWKILLVAALIALIIDAVKDFFFRRLELVDPKA